MQLLVSSIDTNFDCLLVPKYIIVVDELKGVHRSVVIWLVCEIILITTLPKLSFHKPLHEPLIEQIILRFLISQLTRDKAARLT